MTKEEYGDFVLRYKGCVACFPMYHTLSRFEKMWFSAIQKDVATLEKENAELKKTYRKQRNKRIDELQKENKELKKQLEMSNKVYNDNLDYSHHIEGQLTRAKEIIRSLYFIIQGRIDYKGNIPLEDEMYRANQFLNSEVEK